MKIALLINATENIQADNYLWFARELLGLGHSVTLGFIDSLAMSNKLVTIRGFDSENSQLIEGTPFAELEFYQLALNHYELVWVLALGQRVGFLDKIQLLHNLERDTRLVNSTDAILHLKSKYYLNTLSEVFPHPESHAASNWHQLFDIIQSGGGDWIIKPPAGSFGWDVFKVAASDANLKSILQSMTGHESGQYCLIQRYVDEIDQGEKRVLLANGEVVGQYHRQNHGDHRTNLAQGAEAEICDLTKEEMYLCERIGHYLREQRALFVAMDLAYPFVIELNVINPGGIGTLHQLTGNNLADKVINRILSVLE